jgi:hypothetical protein
MSKKDSYIIKTLSLQEVLDGQEVHDCNRFFADIITQLMTDDIADGDTIATSLCMLAHDMLVAQHMTSYEIQEFVDTIFPRTGYQLHLHD